MLGWLFGMLKERKNENEQESWIGYVGFSGRGVVGATPVCGLQHGPAPSDGFDAADGQQEQAGGQAAAGSADGAPGRSRKRNAIGFRNVFRKPLVNPRGLLLQEAREVVTGNRLVRPIIPDSRIVRYANPAFSPRPPAFPARLPDRRAYPHPVRGQ